ncbi:MAG: D-alanine--D-alanine ligase family protein [Candidatus Nanopelagicales bacterium]
MSDQPGTPRRVAVLLGGQSSEHSISCISAAGVIRALLDAGFIVTAVGITRDGVWVHLPNAQVLQMASDSALPEVPANARPFAAGVQPGATGGLGDVADVVFPVLHGPWGEDGTVQGFLELTGIPYVGSGVLASAVAMHKSTMKSLLVGAGLPVGSWCAVTAHRWRNFAEEVRAEIEELSWPVFVKPARAGSSVGISRVTDPAGISAAIDYALSFDPHVIVESGVVAAREIECAVITDEDGVPQASCCAEIVVGPGHDFYDFQAKYLDDAATLIVPAVLSESQAAAVEKLACHAFTVLSCEGLARVDFFVTDNDVIINEVNTMPGFTPISMFPRMWAESGLGYQQLVTHLVHDAWRRGTGLR